MLHLARNIVGNSLQLSKMSACGHTYVQMGSNLQLPRAGAQHTFSCRNCGHTYVHADISIFDEYIHPNQLCVSCSF